MRILVIIFTICVAIIGLSFAVMNANVVELNYYLGVAELPLSLIVVISFAMGAGFGILAAVGVILRLKRGNLRLRREVKLTEKELVNLRKIPIKSSP